MISLAQKRYNYSYRDTTSHDCALAMAISVKKITFRVLVLWSLTVFSRKSVFY